MKIIAALLLLALLPVFAAAEEPAPFTAVWGTPTVDAQVDEVWASTPAYPVKAGDTSASVRVLWDDKALYVLAEITDPNLDNTAAAPYMQDSVEVFLDERCNRTTYYQQDDMHTRVSYTNHRSVDNGSESRWYTAAAVTDTGYTVECAWEWAVITPANGHIAGFDVQVNVCKGGNRSATPCLNDTTGLAYQNTSLFGTLELTGKPENAATPAYPYALRLAIEKAESRDLSLYVNGESVDAPLNAAKALAFDPAATQEQLDSAALALSDALNNLDDGSPYDPPERLAMQYQLPDLMTFLDGTKVETAEDWALRRAEIKGLYEYYMYGYMPDTSGETLTWTAQNDMLVITVANNSKEVQLYVPYVLPAGEAPEGGWPYYVEYSWWGTSDIVKYAATRGYAGFGYSPYAVAADDSSYTGAFYTLYPYGEHYKTQTGTLVAWTWGVSKIIDALEQGAGETLGINPEYSLVGGVSRFGKSVAVAGAYEERIKVVIPSCSGAGGLGMLRYSSAGKTYDLTSLGYTNSSGTGLWTNGTCESWGNMRAEGAYHWYCGNFRRFTAQEQVPFDQHMLEALSASPDRHMVVITGVLSEEWNNVEGQTMAFVGAQPAWDVLGAGDQNNMIVHLSGHAILQSDMELILDYCDKVLYGKEPTLDLSVMKTNVFMEEGNASDLLKELMGK
ncbi:MAG: hypothetical protein IJ438_03835 [Clostridia bacterium]|nr:hypothetical protein [Clostridia bacterium]